MPIWPMNADKGRFDEIFSRRLFRSTTDQLVAISSPYRATRAASQSQHAGQRAFVGVGPSSSCMIFLKNRDSTRAVRHVCAGQRTKQPQALRQVLADETKASSAVAMYRGALVTELSYWAVRDGEPSYRLMVETFLSNVCCVLDRAPCSFHFSIRRPNTSACQSYRS